MTWTPEQRQRWRESHPNYPKAFREKHREELRQYKRNHYLKNREKILAQTKAYKARDPERWRRYRDEWYQRNKERILTDAAEKRKEIRELIIACKDVPCADCGERYPFYVMDFDHVSGERKKEVGAMRNVLNMEKVIEEILKCEVVCANCHRIRTYGGKAWQSRTSTVM